MFYLNIFNVKICQVLHSIFWRFKRFLFVKYCLLWFENWKSFYDFGFAIEWKENQKVKYVYDSIKFVQQNILYSNNRIQGKKIFGWYIDIIFNDNGFLLFVWNKNVIKQTISCECYHPFNVFSKMKEWLKMIFKNPDERLSIEQIRKYVQLTFFNKKWTIFQTIRMLFIHIFVQILNSICLNS
jgi:hypothetical protein